MQRNTPTTFGELRLGDRFYFVGDKAKKAHQVTSERLSERSRYNIIHGDGQKAWPFDREAKRDKPVVFLRHTVAVPGEEILLYYLQQGDVFFLPGNIVFEYLVLDTEGLNTKEKYLVECINSEDNKMMWLPNDLVIYLRRSDIKIDQKRIANAPFNH